MRVLLVEDNADNAARTQAALREGGIECDVATDQEACLAALHRRPGYDLLLIEQLLANTTGFHVLVAVRGEGPSLPAIMLADRGGQRVAASAVRAGVADYLIKEPDLSHLRLLPGAVRRVVRARAATPPGGRFSQESPAEKEEELRHLVLVDPLTGLYNRRFLHDALSREFSAARRYGHPLCCAMMDLDHFKDVNDTQGHLVGDEVLTGVAERVREAFRSPDLCFRYGGEEFTVLMPHTDSSQALTAWRRFLSGLRCKPLPTDAGELGVTASVGVTCLRNDNFARPEDLLSAADVALYTAKRQGRDRVVLAEGAAPVPDDSSAAA